MIAESEETDFLPLVKSVYGDTSEAVLKGALFASYIYKEGEKKQKKILLECDGELKAKGSRKHIKQFNQMFPVVSEKKNTPKIVQSKSEDHIVLTEEIYKQILENAVKARESELRDAHGEERAILQAQIDELKSRQADPEKALQDEQELKIKIRADLEREGNEIGNKKLMEAWDALEEGNFSKADDLFAEIEAREELAVKRSARAAFARGEIAEQEIRWYDAAKHYARAAQVDPSFDTLMKAQELAFSIGDYYSALSFGKDAKKAAIKEHGKDTEEYAASLNDIGVVYDRLKEYKLAEPLHKEALKIRQDILGKKHPDIAKSLNNLGGIYLEKKQYKEATYFLKRALNINKEMLGIKHSLTATTLNNLGGSYRDMGEFKKAKPLLKQALKIRKEILGDNQPDTANSYNILGGFYSMQGQYKKADPYLWQALEILEMTLGPDHPDTILVKG
ncbi:MAG: tetratricopeptide repeat protein, partial [Proteobacteria bacterium]|nr:tetratricopeptide repeat protein [Pseudomonadota bacterium]